MSQRHHSPKYRYLVYLENYGKFTGDGSKKLLKFFQSIVLNHSQLEIRDLRVSSYFMELDLGTSHQINLDDNNWPIIQSLTRFGYLLRIEEISEHETNLSVNESLNVAILLFNMERFWKSHEVLEQVWKKALGQEKALLNGIILVDAAFVHLQKGEYDVYFSILLRCLEKFENAPDFFYNVNLKNLIEHVKIILSEEEKTCFKIQLR